MAALTTPPPMKKGPVLGLLGARLRSSGRGIGGRRSAWRSCGLRVVSAIARPLAGFCGGSLGGLLAGGLISTGPFFVGGGVVSAAMRAFLAGALCLHWLSSRWV